jgi:hypothetical protein
MSEQALNGIINQEYEQPFERGPEWKGVLCDEQIDIEPWRVHEPSNIGRNPEP